MNHSTTAPVKQSQGECPVCRGSKIVTVVKENQQFTRACLHCGGSGVKSTFVTK